MATLTGTVATFAESAEAEDLAATVDGISGVHDDLFVRRPYGLTCSSYRGPYFPRVSCSGYAPSVPIKSDPELLNDVRSRLFWSPFVDSNQLDVSVHDGKVTLSGQVDTKRERAEALDDAYEAGAVAINDDLKLVGGDDAAQ